MNLCPLLMIKNEEYYIEYVLRGLAAFPHVIVLDTGSTDRTREIVASFSNVRLEVLGDCSPEKLGSARSKYSNIAKDLGYDWCLMVDGDEMYWPDEAASLLTQDMPAGTRFGFVPMQSIEEEAGKWYLLDDRFNRSAIFPTGYPFKGNYPYESPVDWSPPYFTYFSPINHPIFAYHLKRLTRSPRDADVVERVSKQKLFFMQEIAVKRLSEIPSPFPTS